ncbi:MAG: DUF4340 domain-containing protein [Ruminococcus sp.]|jgi:hypothetical protein|nr:DUF4340 domain-containing protein [Ruminococcus sp.]
MSKNIKLLIICVCALVLVGGALAFLLYNEKDNKDSGTDVSSDGEVYIINEWKEGNTYATQDVKSIHIKTTGEETDWHLAEPVPVNDSGSDETSNSRNGAVMPFVDEYDIVQGDDGGVTIPQLEGNTLEETTLPTMPAVILSETAVSVVERNATDLSQYGLTDSGKETTINFKDGESYTIVFGNVSPKATETYIQIKGINNVYTMYTSVVQRYTSQKEFFVSKVICPDKETQVERVIDTVEIHRNDIYGEVLRFESVQLMEGEEVSDIAARHRMTKPIDFAIDVETSYDAVYGFYGLSALNVVNVDEDNLEDFYSGDEFCVVDIKISDTEKHTLRFIRNNDTYYGIVDDLPTVYEFSEKLWFTVQPEDINSTLVLTTRIFDVRTLDIWAKDADESMKFVGEGSNTEDYTVSLNGTVTEYERFQQFYSFLVKMSAEEICVKANMGEKLASVDLKDRWDREKSIVFYEDTDEPRKVDIVINGQIVAKCRKSFVDVFAGNINMFGGDEEFVRNW